LKRCIGVKRGLASLLVTFVLGLSGHAVARQVSGSAEMDLKPGEGREIVAEHCLVCHDATLITAPELTRSQWERVIGEMIEEQGMEEPRPEIRQAILDYLVQTQGIGP
jgi:mono/diheme cytochrome c family protein